MTRNFHRNLTIENDCDIMMGSLGKRKRRRASSDWNAYNTQFTKMEIVREDVVDWEPIQIRCQTVRNLTKREASKLAQFIQTWFEETSNANPNDWKMAKEWQATVDNHGEVIASCDLMPSDAVLALSVAIEENFPVVSQLRLGFKLKSPLGARDWVRIPMAKHTHDYAFTISFSPVTIGEFCDFLRATNYVPIPDRTEHPGFAVEFVQGAYGTSKKLPMFGATHYDAEQYCEWAGYRLPTQTELERFFVDSCNNNRDFDFAFPCWSSTLCDEESAIAVDGPYNKSTIGGRDTTKLLSRSHYGWPEPACFRVVDDSITV